MNNELKTRITIAIVCLAPWCAAVILFSLGLNLAGCILLIFSCLLVIMSNLVNFVAVESRLISKEIVSASEKEIRVLKTQVIMLEEERARLENDIAILTEAEGDDD